MSDLIDRQEAIDTLRKWDAVPDYNEAEHHIMRAVMAMLEDMPSAEPKKAQWEYYPALYAYGVPHYKCSLCGHQVQYRTPFCPGCGSYNGGESET